MSLSKSKYLKPTPKEKWIEKTISEENVSEAIKAFLRVVPSSEYPSKDIHRVIVGDLVNGQYLLSILVKKGVEDKDGT